MRIRREDSLYDPACAHPLDQLRDLEVVGTDAVHRGDRAMEHVVTTLVLTGALNREHIQRLLHNADDSAVALIRRADHARVRLRDVEAYRAVAKIGLYGTDRRRERGSVRHRRPQDVIGDPLRGLGADTG